MADQGLGYHEQAGGHRDYGERGLGSWGAGHDPQDEQAGESWSPQTSGTTQTLYAVDKISDSVAFIVGSSDTFLKTTNGGVSWEKPLTFGIAGPFASPDFHGVDFITSQPNIGWAVGSKFTLFGTTYASIFKTTGGGASWTKQSSPVVKNFRDIDMFSTLVGWIVGDDGTILKTTNGGTTWVQQGVGVTAADLYSVHAIDANEVWAVGAGGVILHTANGGTTWSIVSSGTTNHLFGVSFASSGAGWAVGASGTIRHYSDFDFVIDALPSSRTIAAGSSGNLTPTITSAAGFSAPVTLSVSGEPPGVSHSFSPPSVTPPSGGIRHIQHDDKRGRFGGARHLYPYDNRH